MRRFIDALATSAEFARTACEEASRFGQRTVDVEHLFLALALDEQQAGRALREVGITLVAARRAVADLHAEQLASIGVQAELPTSELADIERTGDFDWAPRALEVLKLRSNKDELPYATTLLRNLLTEPSGLVPDLLRRLGTTPGAIEKALDDTVTDTGRRNATARIPGISGSRQAFVPAPVTEIWALLADPRRMPEWDVIGSVEFTGDVDTLRPGDAWTGLTATPPADAKARPVRPQWRRQRIELLARNEESRIAWRFSFPDAPKASHRLVAVELKPAPGGTRLRVSLAWQRDHRRHGPRLPEAALRRIYRLPIWVQLSVLITAISRVFR